MNKPQGSVPPEGEKFSYGEGCADNKEKKKISTIQKILTLLNGNPRVASRLSNALGLKDVPGHPPAADMSEVKIVTDMFQAGFSGYDYFNPAPISTLNVGHPPRQYYLGYLASPNFLPGIDDAANVSTFTGQQSSYVVGGAGPKTALIRNNTRELRICNAWLRYKPDQATNLNPYADTNPMALHGSFELDGNVVWEQVQNNIVSSAADWSFMFQTSDGFWNGVVPIGSTLRVKFWITDGLTGLPKFAADPDDLDMGVVAFGVPAGMRVPR